MPTGWAFKALKFRKLAFLFKLKRGKAVVKAGEEAAEQALMHGDDAAKASQEIVLLLEETFNQALSKAVEKSGDYLVYGTKGLVGKTFNRNIVFPEMTEGGRKSLAGLRALISSFEAEAINAGANKISIYGGAIVNEGLFNPNTAARFGYSFERSGGGIILQKILTP